MVNATNVDAHAVNTVAWLSDAVTSIVVPVYQRQYRWDIGGCEQLLADIRAVADTDNRHMHFIGSILSAQDDHSTGGELVLIDGQQRTTTLMLLIAALQHTIRDTDPVLAEQLQRVLVRPDAPDRTKLRPHRAWADVFESVVLDRRGEQVHDSRFDDNYAFFRSQVRAEEVPRVWRGLQKLEHVAITLGAGANAQQIFESLNSTGEPLKDHELIHNYVLMGLSHRQQIEIEDDYWLPIEQDTGELIGDFWRHYLVMRTGRDVTGPRGVYDAFRAEFPRLDAEHLRRSATQWREYARIYRTLLSPSRESNTALAHQLTHLNTFGRGMYPLLMHSYRDYAQGALSAEQLIGTLEQIQSLLLRRRIVNIETDTLVARLCRARTGGPDALAHAIDRITPSDERVRIALKYEKLPHPRYVLGRIGGLDPAATMHVEHIFPLAPTDNWSGDGTREWAEYSEDEQNSHRALALSLGNLTLLEPELSDRALDDRALEASFVEKRDRLYPESALALTRELGEVPAWGTAAIAERTAALTARFMQTWQRQSSAGIDDDGIIPILDAIRRRGWPQGWQREFAYVEYRGEHWEVPDVKYLFNRIFKRLWADSREDVVAFSTRRGGPIYPEQSWTGHWDALDESNYLYMGWDSRYMLTAVQGVLEEAGIASEVFVKYSHIGVLM